MENRNDRKSYYKGLLTGLAYWRCRDVLRRHQLRHQAARQRAQGMRWKHQVLVRLMI